MTGRAVIFDLDGVIVDTAKYHYLAWRKFALELGFDFTEEDNEHVKGVSRRETLEFMLKVGRITIPEEKKVLIIEAKNSQFLSMWPR